MLPMYSIIGNGYAQWRAGTFRRSGDSLKIIIYQHMTTVFQGHGIKSGIVVFNVEQSHFAPCITIVTAPARSHLGIACAADYLQATIFVPQDSGLDAIDRLRAFSLDGLAGFHVVRIGSPLLAELRRHGELCLHRAYLTPRVAIVIRDFKVYFPTVALGTARANDAPVHILRLVLRRA